MSLYFEALAAVLKKSRLAAFMLRDLMTSFRGSRSETLVHGHLHGAFAVIGPLGHLGVFFTDKSCFFVLKLRKTFSRYLEQVEHIPSPKVGRR